VDRGKGARRALRPYEDLDAFNLHANGKYFKEFFAAIGAYVEGPTWLIKGNRVNDSEAR
jgi:hypothetical protein